MTGNFHVRFGGRERDVLERGVTLPTQCGDGGRLSVGEAAISPAVIRNQATYLAGWLP